MEPSEEKALELIMVELEHAKKKHPAWHGARHGHSVIEEEYEEFKEEIFSDKIQDAVYEASQLAATCIRFISKHYIPDNNSQSPVFREAYKELTNELPDWERVKAGNPPMAGDMIWEIGKFRNLGIAYLRIVSVVSENDFVIRKWR